MLIKYLTNSLQTKCSPAHNCWTAVFGYISIKRILTEVSTMKNIALLFILFILIFSGCSDKSKKEVINIANLGNNVIQNVQIDTLIGDVDWSFDSKYFTFVDGHVNSDWVPQKSFIRVYSANGVSSITLPKEINPGQYKTKASKWIDNTRIITYAKNKEKEIICNLFDVSKNDIQSISYSDYTGYENISENHLSDYKKEEYYNNENISIMEMFPIKLSKAILFQDKKRAIYTTQDNDVYYRDLVSGDEEFLFQGFLPSLSPGETKILYFLSNRVKPAELRIEGNYSGKELEMYIYDMENHESTKLADYYAKYYFSFDDKYLIFFMRDYWGSPYV